MVLPDPPPHTLRIRLFGLLTVEDPDRAEAVRVTNGAATLLAYLVLGRERPHARSELAGVFWGDQPERRARSCLSTAIWRLRSVLEPDGVPRGRYITSTRDGVVGFNAGQDCWVDVEVFEKVIGRNARGAADEAGMASALAGVLGLYRGGLLADLYDDWAVAERERLELLYLRGLTRLMELHVRAGQLDGAIADAQRILRRDPLREDVHRALMRLYASIGQRPLAVRQYLRCQEILRHELDIPPMDETRALREAIVRGDDELPAERARAGL